MDLEVAGRVYERELFDNVLPFWLTHGWDKKAGGIITALGRDGEILDSDKSVWFQGRTAWMYATVFNDTSNDDSNDLKQECRNFALSCCDFLISHCIDAEKNKMFFTVTREGQPLRMRRYVYSESFAAIGLAATFRATKEPKYRDHALRAWKTYLRYSFEPGVMEPKTYRATRSIGPLMIAIATAQELRLNLGESEGETPSYTAQIASWIAEIERYFVKEKIVMESVGLDGEILDHFDTRLLNPGHAIECAWFILREYQDTGSTNEALLRLGLRILDLSWQLGWDHEQGGGLLYFGDALQKPIQEYWSTMKFWWPHCEAIIAALMAFEITGDFKYAEMHQKAHDYFFKHFLDTGNREYFGYLDRQGKPTTVLKGNFWKGPFHIPRALFVCWKICKKIKK